ncbi:MAG TPA: aminoglycoside phosphotransferase family protein [Solirubrobacteraceae bacterium]|nr:aminoglycoside phosphotransferase family protein [Solirubrobacteraceae bacterium]
MARRALVAGPREVLAGLAAVLPGAEAMSEPRVLPRGFGSEAWLVETSGGTLVVKIALRWPSGERQANAAEAARLAAAQHVLTPQALAVAPPSPIFGSRAYSVWEYLDGLDAEEALADMSQPEVVRFFTDLGSTLARLHSRVSARYAGAVTGSEGEASWTEAVADRLARLEARYLDAGLRVDDRTRQAAARIKDLADQVSPLSEAVLVHSDMYLDNLLVSSDGSPVVLDFEHARFADAGVDFVKPELLISDRYPQAPDAIFDAYQQARSVPEIRTRILLALGLELVWGIPFFHQWKDDDVVDLYRTRLMHWLSQ